jgi:hypothetical protein
MDKEVHNDENIKWETVNVIKRWFISFYNNRGKRV